MATSIWGTLIFSLCSSDCGSDCSAFSERFTVVWRIQILILMNLCMLIDNVDCKITEFCERTFDEDKQEQNPGIDRHHYSWNKKAWWGQYCCVPLCRSSSGERAQRESV